MRAEIAFRRQGVVDVDAAVVGISRSRWVAVTEETPEAEARALMRQSGFDVLPIDGDGRVRAFFATRDWGNYTEVERASLRHSDVIPFNTPLREVIRRLAQEERGFFFLGEDGEVVGLITVANLNCRQVSVLLFGLLVELEVLLGRGVRAHFGDDLRAAIERACGSERAADILQRFDRDQQQGLDAPLIEYVYLSDLVNLAVDAKMHTRLGYSATKFRRDAGALVALRNQVAHPARSVVDAANPVSRLWERVDRAEALLFALR